MPRSCLAAAMVYGIIYVIGGHVGGGRSTSTIEAYDSATDTWTKKANMPTHRRAAGGVAPFVDGLIYVIGGQINSSW